MGGDSWVILSPIEQSIKSKIEKYGVPLKDWNVSINYGVKTGFNDAFIIDGAKRAQLIEQDPKSAEIIRPILRGRDIKRYGYDFADLYLICTFPSRKIDIEQYPAIKSHLLSFGKERLEQTGKTYIVNGEKIHSRKKTCNKWFETQDQINYWDDFSKQKIIYSEIVRSPQFYLDQNRHFYPEATSFIMTGMDLESIIACLNSKLFSYCFKRFYSGGGLGEDGFRYKKAFLINLPLPKFTSEVREEIKRLVQSINESNQQNEIDRASNQIDVILCAYLGISDTEIKYIENSICW